MRVAVLQVNSQANKAENIRVACDMLDRAAGAGADIAVLPECVDYLGPKEGMLDVANSRVINHEPSITVSLDDACRLQARLEVLTRTDNYQVRTGDYNDEEISVYLTVRRYWGDRPREPMDRIFADLFERADHLCADRIVPRVLRPISSAIASRS